MLRDAGYHIGESYKVWSPGTPADAPFGAGKFAYEKAGGRFNNFSENVTKLVSQGIPLEDAKQSMYAEVQKILISFSRCANQESLLYWLDQPMCIANG